MGGNVKKIMEEIDVNNDGSVSYNEWCMVAINKRLIDKEERLMHLFKKIDENGDGKLSKEELKKAISKLDPNFDVESAVKEVDLDNDGNIDYTEFLKVFGDML